MKKRTTVLYLTAAALALAGSVGILLESVTAEVVKAEMQPVVEEISWESKTFKVPVLERGKDSLYVIGSYELPSISVTGDKVFEASVNKRFKGDIQASIEEFTEEVKDSAENYEDMVQNGEKDLAASFLEALSQSEYLGNICLLSKGQDYFALANHVYAFTGGAHGTEALTVYNVDLSEKKLLKLSDLFKSSDYEAVLLNHINNAIANKPEYENKIYSDREKITSLSENFFISGKDLVIFYEPYEIGPGYTGVIDFEIKISDIKGILKERYAKLDAETMTSMEDVSLY